MSFTIVEVDGGEIQILDSGGTVIDPATNATVAAIQAAVEAIRDTAGIKKITDALPAGANRIGKVTLRDPGDTVDLGDATNPVRTDPTGSTTQPVSAASLPLPTGAATEATLATRATASTQTDGTQKSQVVDGTGDGLEIDASGRAAVQDPPNLDAALSTRATETTLAAIKDTAGVKKITDALPTGDNALGKVKILDSGGTNVAGVTSTGALKVTQATNASQIRTDKVKNGGSSDLVVDGSGTPVNFTFPADGTDDLFLQKLILVLVTNSLKFDDVSFGSIGALTNGVRVAVTSDSAETVLATLKKSEDLAALNDRPFLETGLSANDLVVASFDFGGTLRLVGGSGDKVEVRIQDDMAPAGANSLKHFTATVYATTG